jgi:hypothetical protein
MTVEDLNILIYFIISKNNAQGDVSPDEFNIIINRAQYSFQSYLIGLVQEYQNGRPVSRIDYSSNEKIRQKLTPFIIEQSLTIPNTGVYNYPTDFILVDSMTEADGSPIRFIAQDKQGAIRKSQIDVIEDNPGYMIKESGFQFYPVTLGNAVLSYVGKAPAIVYNTQLDGSGRTIFNPTGSVNPIWYDTDILEVAMRALDIIGVPLQLNQVRQYANEIKTQGQ